MSVQIIGEVQIGTADLLARDVSQVKGSARTIISRDITTAKNRMRRRVRTAGFSDRFANMIRGDVTVEEERITGRIFSKGTVKGRPGGPFDLIVWFWEGGTITGHPRLAIPNRAKVPNRKESPASFGGRDFFDVVPLRRGRTAMLVPKAHPEEGPYFWLVDRVTQQSLYDLAQDIDRLGLNLADRINQEWGRRLVRQARRAA